MRYVRLGNTGLNVSQLGIGTATFGGQCDEVTSHAILDHAAELGISFIDTADKYPLGSTYESAGRTEATVGRWLRGRRDDFVLASKVHGPTGPNLWDRGLSRRHVLSAIDATLTRLGTDYLDLYQLHRPDPDTPIEETLAALDTIVQAGKARYVGCSNFLAYQVALALGASRMHGWASFVSVQPRYNLLFRQPERELLPMCAEQGIAVLPYNPLAGGLLTGKHPRSGPAPGSRFASGPAVSLYQDRYWQSAELDAADVLANIAAEAGLPLTTIAVAWVMANPVVTAPILGATRPGHLDDSVAAAVQSLDADLLAALDRATAGFRCGDAAE